MLHAAFIRVYDLDTKKLRHSIRGKLFFYLPLYSPEFAVNPLLLR